MNAISSKADLLGSISLAALALHLDQLELRHREIDRLPRPLPPALKDEMERNFTQTESLAKAIVNGTPATPTDALVVIAAALYLLDDIRLNERPFEKMDADMSTARRSIIRSLDVLTTGIGVTYQEIGANYFMAGPGEPGYPAAVDRPDAELLQACSAHATAHAELEAHFDKFPGDVPDDDPVLPALMRTHTEAVGLVCTLKAVTAAGHQARARALSRVAPGLARKGDNPDEAPYERLKAALVRDLVGSAVA